MTEYYVPLNKLPQYCRECPCHSEGFEYSFNTGLRTAVYVQCRITEQIVAKCQLGELSPDWNRVPRPEDCPIVHWLYISVGDCDGKN